MYVCVCNAIKETDLRAAARCCQGDAEALYASLGSTPQCRQCLEQAEEIIAEEMLDGELAICGELAVATAH